jgi:electron transport complex protein RnfB
MNRRKFLREGLWGACLAGLGTAAGLTVARNNRDNTVWQIDPGLCIKCGQCATHCVLELSAVKCVQAYALCGYCDLCTGYLVPEPTALDTSAENALCPTGAIQRTYIEDPYYQYTIDESPATAAASASGARPGNGSLYSSASRPLPELQRAPCCRVPSQAFRRSRRRPYLLKGTEPTHRRTVRIVAMAALLIPS